MLLSISALAFESGAADSSAVGRLLIRWRRNGVSVRSLGTKWGLFRHYWVLISFALTIFATLVLLQHMQTVSFFAGVAAEMNSADIGRLRGGLRGELLHAGASTANLE